MSKAIFAVLSLIAAPAFTLAAGHPPAAQASEAKVIIPVEGTTCAACTLAIHNALQRLDGVKAVEASHEKGQAVVTYDPAKVKPQQMVDAVNKAGFKAGRPVKG